MKKIKKVMATLLAAALVLGSTMTAFAAEKTNLDTENITVNLSYSRDDADGSGTGGEGDDSKRDIINIDLEYDNLNFEYKATSIEWDPDIKDYRITLNGTSFEKGIKVTNNSNVKIGVTPGINNNNAVGVPVGFRFDFRREGADAPIASADNIAGANVAKVSEGAGKSEKVLGITNTDNVDTFKASMSLPTSTGSSTGNLIASNVKPFSQEVTTITLAFRAASSNVPTTGGSEHTGGGAH